MKDDNTTGKNSTLFVEIIDTGIGYLKKFNLCFPINHLYLF